MSWMPVPELPTQLFSPVFYGFLPVNQAGTVAPTTFMSSPGTCYICFVGLGSREKLWPPLWHVWIYSQGREAWVLIINDSGLPSAGMLLALVPGRPSWYGEHPGHDLQFILGHLADLLWDDYLSEEMYSGPPCCMIVSLSHLPFWVPLLFLWEISIPSETDPYPFKFLLFLCFQYFYRIK